MSDNKLIIADINESEGIAWLTLSRPEKKNALSVALLSELAGILRSLADNEKIRCIVTSGAGGTYSSGRDLYDMRGQENRRRTRGIGGVAEIVDIMRKLPQVTIAVVRGWCLGGGLAMISLLSGMFFSYGSMVQKFKDQRQRIQAGTMVRTLAGPL